MKVFGSYLLYLCKTCAMVPNLMFYLSLPLLFFIFFILFYFFLNQGVSDIVSNINEQSSVLQVSLP